MTTHRSVAALSLAMERASERSSVDWLAERLVRGVEPVDWEGVEEEDLDPLPSLEAPLAAWRKKADCGYQDREWRRPHKVEAKDSDAAT